MRAALGAAGAGVIGDYDSASFSTPGEGRFRPAGRRRTRSIGEVGRLEVVDEVRVECVLPRAARPQVVAALLAAHPYEEPAYDVVELADPGVAEHRVRTDRHRRADHARGVRRPRRAGPARAPRTASGWPATRTAPYDGWRCAAEPGDFLLDDVRRSDADVYLTSDLRHHPAAEFLEHGGPALVDVAHWAAEWTWLPVVEARLAEALRARALRWRHGSAPCAPTRGRIAS